MKSKQISKTNSQKYMKELNAKEESNSKSIAYYFILNILAFIFLFIESIFILISSLKRGFLKKEVLTSKSNLGFDIVIKN